VIPLHPFMFHVESNIGRFLLLCGRAAVIHNTLGLREHNSKIPSSKKKLKFKSKDPLFKIEWQSLTHNIMTLNRKATTGSFRRDESDKNEQGKDKKSSVAHARLPIHA
jgi:hypothetical protein